MINLNSTVPVKLLQSQNCANKGKGFLDFIDYDNIVSDYEIINEVKETFQTQVFYKRTITSKIVVYG